MELKHNADGKTTAICTFLAGLVFLVANLPF